MTEKELLKILGTKRSSRFCVRCNLLSVPNVSYGFLKHSEADLLVVNKNRYVYEVEVKVSAADFKNDMKKMKWRLLDKRTHRSKLIKRFYYAMPVSIWEKVKDEPRIEGSGIVTVDDKTHKITEVISAVENREAEPLSEADALRLARLASMRYWNVIGRDI